MVGSVSSQDLVHQNWKIGRWALVNTNRGPCLFVKAGHRLKGPQGYKGDSLDDWDTIIDAWYCSADVTIDKLGPAISRARIVEDRAAHRKALIDAGRLKPPS